MPDGSKPLSVIWSLMRPCDINLSSILKEMLKISISDKWLKIIDWRLQLYIPGFSEWKALNFEDYYIFIMLARKQ